MKSLVASNFKTPDIAERFNEVHPKLKEIAEDMCSWCSDRSLPLVVTAAKSTDVEDRALKRISKTHQEGRAFDMSRRGWTQEHIDEFTAHFTAKYASVASLNVGNFPNLIVHHDIGSGDHLHIQIRRGLDV